MSETNSEDNSSTKDIFRPGRKIIKESVETKTADPGEETTEAPPNEDQ